MIWIILMLAGVGAFVLASRRDGADKLRHRKNAKSFTIRDGKRIETDATFDAWTSGNLRKMLSALQIRTNKIDRHFLLQSIVDRCYKNRKDPSLRSKCVDIARLHLHEFPSIAPALKRDMGGALPRVSTFQQLATVLTEDGEYEEAIAVCQMAKTFGLHDGTKSGFDGRIARIRKKQSA